jgi:ABC-type sugar transport system permease subunit
MAFILAFQHTLIYLILYVPSVLAARNMLLLNQPLRGLTLFRMAFLSRVSSWVALSGLALDF